MHNGGGGRVSGTVSAIINSKPGFSVWVFCMAVSQALLCQRELTLSSLKPSCACLLLQPGCPVIPLIE